MRRLLLVFPLLAAFAVVGGAFAEEVVYFNNGTSMPIRSHRVEAGMIHVDLGDNGFMAFPEYMVDRIDGGSSIQLKPSTKAPLQSEGGMMAVVGGGPLGGESRAPQRVNNGVQTNPDVVRDEKTGLSMYKPMKDHAAANRRNIGAAGHQAVFGAPVARTRQEGLIGTRRVGDRFVIGNVDRRQRNRQTSQLIGIERRSSGPVRGRQSVAGGSGGGGAKND
jgi:hypothetical protein